VRRALNFLSRNWPLKLGAILLATVLYSGLVLGQNVRTWTGKVPVDPIRPPAGATLINELDPVTTIRYRAPLEVGVLSPDSFRATVDLSRIEAEAGGPQVTVPVTLIAVDPGVQIVDFQPREIAVQLDPVQDREMPISVVLGSKPDSISIGPPQLDPSTVTVRGASSRVTSISAVQARVSFDASALNVDRDIDLVAVDANGNEVPNVQLDPQRVHVRIAVAQELATRTLPIVPHLTGAPAPGYRITSVSVDPLVVTVSGEAATVSQLQNAPTSDIDITGRTSDLEAEVGFNLPSGVSITGADRVRVRLTISEDTGSQTYAVGVVLSGEQPGFSYSLATQQVNVTLGGPTADLEAVDASGLAVTADVAGLGEGPRIVRVNFTAPPGLTIVGINPTDISVIVSPPPSPSPSPSDVPSQ
jgi:YbbR domain-containing protein